VNNPAELAGGGEAPDREEVYALTPGFVREVVDALDERAAERTRALVRPLHAADLADLIALLRSDERRALVEALGPDLDPHVLSELDEATLDEVLDLLAPSDVAAAVAALETDDALYILQNLPEETRAAILRALPPGHRLALESGLSFPEYTAGRLMRQQLVAVPPFWTVGQTIDHLREAADLPAEFYEVFVVDPAHHPVGTVPLSRLMRNKRPVPIADILDAELTTIPGDMDQEEVAYLFEQYNLVSAPVVDPDGRLLGVITIDDVVDVIQEEAHEDILRLGGVGQESISDPVFRVTRRRFWWLFVNLLTAVLASAVISLFEGTLEKFVALAVLMPIVASQGGNAATQTMTVAVRALATNELNAANAVRIVVREVLVGGVNGVLFALILGIGGGLWAHSAWIGLVLAGAMIINLIAAGLAGILVPLALNKADVDPAVASGAFVTTVTDVVGFFAFLGLASLVLFETHLLG
jgi:magnesium transporter